MGFREALKAFTKITLMLPVIGFFVIGSYMALKQMDMSGYVQFATAFAAIYVPSLTAYVTGTSVKRSQEKKG